MYSGNTSVIRPTAPGAMNLALADAAWRSTENRRPRAPGVDLGRISFSSDPAFPTTIVVGSAPSSSVLDRPRGG